MKTWISTKFLLMPFESPLVRSNWHCRLASLFIMLVLGGRSDIGYRMPNTPVKEALWDSSSCCSNCWTNAGLTCWVDLLQPWSVPALCITEALFSGWIPFLYFYFSLAYLASSFKQINSRSLTFFFFQIIKVILSIRENLESTERYKEEILKLPVI